jgi:hypothetical protein
MMSCHEGHLQSVDIRSADMLPPTMQGGDPEREGCSYETGDDAFEEMVRAK